MAKAGADARARERCCIDMWKLSSLSVFLSTADTWPRGDFGQRSIIVVPGCAVRPPRKVYKEFENAVARSQGQFSNSLRHQAGLYTCLQYLAQGSYQQGRVLYMSSAPRSCV